MKLHIKNMVCDRCIMVVRNELNQLNLDPLSVELGEVVLSNEIDHDVKLQLSKRLESLGFELLEDKKRQLVEKIKNQIVNLIHHQNGVLRTNLSEYLSHQLNLEYNYISNIFSEMESTTIEKFFIIQKIERIKELLEYDELSLSEIAFQLNYSSAAYLSNQFKKHTGFSPIQFKNTITSKRKPLDKL